jgi:exodeoxyribonuclease VII large subunit
VRALDKLDRYPGLDVVILGRGGGSAEDLMAFNDERVVRRVASMKVPVVSAVGHEVDVSLTDFAADVRAATPSQAAEMVVPDRRSRARALDDQMRHLGRAMHTRLLEAQAQADRLRTKIGDPRFYLAEKQQLLDEARLDLERGLVGRIRDRRQVLERLHRRVLLQHPAAVIARTRAAIAPLSARLTGAMRVRLGGARASLGERVTRIEALSPLAVLGRGYAIAADLEGRVVTDAASLSDGQRISIRLQRGGLLAAVEQRRLEAAEDGA